MTLDPAVIVAAIAALGGLLLFIVRQFMAGVILARTVIPREDYERILSINEGYASKFGEQTAAVQSLAITVAGLAAALNEGRKKP